MKKYFKKWYVLLAMASLILIILVQPGHPLSGTIVGHVFSKMLNMNRMRLHLNEDLDAQKVNIYWNNTLVFFDGDFNRDSMEIPYYEYGDNFFRIEYNSEEIGTAVQYKYNNWHYHIYSFKIHGNVQSLKSELLINGSDTAFYWVNIE